MASMLLPMLPNSAVGKLKVIDTCDRSFKLAFDMTHLEMSRKGGLSARNQSQAAKARWAKTAQEREAKRLLKAAEKFSKRQSLKALPATSPA